MAAIAPALAAPLVANGTPRTAAASTVELTGEWVLNAQASQTLSVPSPVRRPGPGDGRPGTVGATATSPGPAPGPIPPEDSVLPDPPARRDEDTDRAPPPRRPPSWLVRPERIEALRALLGETRSLSIVQTPTYVDLRTEVSSRSLEIGSESQVSLPTGELADQRVRWQAGRLVIERRVPRGVKVVETFQRLPGTDQLEVTVRRSGGPNDGLGKVELRRVFDRDTAEPSSPSRPAGAMPGPRAASSELTQ